jgi:signal transduction histidine kinase
MAKFSVRARAVDMLGRQQIAGIPTAIHELFKNSHDAYATRVEADFIRSQRLLIIRDNGLGMTLNDFTNKWLALGTESKLGLNKDPSKIWTGPKTLPYRPVLGEKGIGRLAIATIAPITFAMSRAVRESGGESIVASLVCWELFEVPGLNIDQIDVPVETFVELPTAADIQRMRQKLIENAKAILPLDSEKRTQILGRLEAYSLDVVAYDRWFSSIKDKEEGEGDEEKNLTLEGLNYGTHFYLSPTDEILSVDVDEDDQTRDAPPLKRVLLGFGNAMQDGVNPPIIAEFRDHKPSGLVNELISGDSFFNESDLLKADHLFEGRFDEYGQFVGTLNIYKGVAEPYVLNWPGNGGKETECGAFSVRLAAVQGRSSESLLDPETHKEIMDKLWRYGGFYVYRDGIRVLPYGQSDYDWLKIENRRTLAAKDWFFSHRRMIGYVAIDSSENSTLIEKAGREGFRENKAFRQFRAILENWLKELAKDYFRERAEHGEDFRERRAELQTKADLLLRRKGQVAARRTEFKASLNRNFDAVNRGEPSSTLISLVDKLEADLRSLENVFPEFIRADSALFEMQTYRDIDKLEKTLFLARPRTFSPSKDDNDAFDSYLEWFENFRLTELEPARKNVAEIVSVFRERFDIKIMQRDRAVAAINAERNEAIKSLRQVRSETEAELSRVDHDIRQLLKSGFDQFKTAAEEVIVDLNRAELDDLTSAEAFLRQRELEVRMVSQLTSKKQVFESVFKQLQGFRADVSDRTTPEETIAALEGRVSELEDQVALYNDLAQAGGAVGIIGHELENVVGGIRESIREIKPWADGTAGLDVAYEKLRVNFDHVDGYLSLFAPLSRRVRRNITNVSGVMILRYLQDAFIDRLKKSGIQLIVTKDFEGFSISTYASTVLASFVNIIDNAIFWIGSSRESDNWIKLDSDSTGFTIENGGPGIPVRIANQIFDFGVSMKPNGRGMGLSVSRDALKSIGLTLELLSDGIERNPVFRIARGDIDTKENNDE